MHHEIFDALRKTSYTWPYDHTCNQLATPLPAEPGRGAVRVSVCWTWSHRPGLWLFFWTALFWNSSINAKWNAASFHSLCP